MIEFRAIAELFLVVWFVGAFLFALASNAEANEAEAALRACLEDSVRADTVYRPPPDFLEGFRLKIEWVLVDSMDRR